MSSVQVHEASTDPEAYWLAVVEFDPTTLQRTIQEKQSELKQANAEIEQSKAQARLTEEQNATALMKAKYDIERARLDLNRGDTVSKIDAEKAKLAFAEAQQRLKELEEKIKSDRISVEADLAGKQRKRGKALADLARADEGLQRLKLTAPTDGIVNVLPNYRAGNMMGSAPEFRQGDRGWPGAAILELPDLSSVHLLARLDESDRSRLKPGQMAAVRIEAVAGREFKARIESISMLARVDYTSTWPPPRNFDLDLVLIETDPRVRPGMTAVARIATEYRQHFRKDVVIDIFCYRRFGHNEGDEPAFTQPLMYRKIRSQTTTREQYAAQLIAEGVITAEETQQMYDKFNNYLEEAFAATQSYRPNKADFLEGAWKGHWQGPDTRGSAELIVTQEADPSRVIGQFTFMEGAKSWTAL